MESVCECWSTLTSSCQQRAQKTPLSLSLSLSPTREQRRQSRAAGIRLENPIEDRLLTPLFPHRPTRFITRHAHEARHDGKVSLVSSYRPLGRPPLVRAPAAAPAITGKADSRCQPPPTSHTGLHLTWKQTRVALAEGTHTANRRTPGHRRQVVTSHRHRLTTTDTKASNADARLSLVR